MRRAALLAGVAGLGLTACGLDLTGTADPFSVPEPDGGRPVDAAGLPLAEAGARDAGDGGLTTPADAAPPPGDAASDTAAPDGVASGGSLELEAPIPIQPPHDVNLTAEGQLDWVHWSLAGTDRAKGGTRLGTLDPGPSPGGSSLFQVTFTWSDGSPRLAVAADSDGLTQSGQSVAFTLPVDASATPSKLLVYVAIVKADGQVSVSMPGVSAPPAKLVSGGTQGLTMYYAVPVIFASTTPASMSFTYQLTQPSGSGTPIISVLAATLATN